MEVPTRSMGSNSILPDLSFSSSMISAMSLWSVSALRLTEETMVSCLLFSFPAYSPRSVLMLKMMVRRGDFI